MKLDIRTARANEAVVVAVRRLRPQLRLNGFTYGPTGIREVRLVGGNIGAWSELWTSVDVADLAKADAEVRACPVTVRGPTTTVGWALMRTARKCKLAQLAASVKPQVPEPRETFDD